MSLSDRQPGEDGVGVGHLRDLLRVDEGRNLEPPHAGRYQPGGRFQFLCGRDDDVNVLQAVAEENVRDFDLHLDHALGYERGASRKCFDELFRGEAGEVAEHFLGVFPQLRSEPPDRALVAGDLGNHAGEADRVPGRRR